MTTVTVQLSASLAQRVRDNDSTAAAAVLAVVRAAMPPDLAAGQQYTDPRGETVEIVAIRNADVVLYYPRRTDHGSRSGVMGLAPLQEAVTQGRWTLIPPPAPAASAWVQPTGAHNAYAIGAVVAHLGKTWESLIAGNATVPGSDPRWWKDLG